MDLAGYLVTPTVRLVRSLRTGARGSIWLAENIALDAPLSVQILDPKLSQDIEAVELFLWGARLAARETSPRAVQLFGSGVTGDGVAYLLQEMLPGEDLAERVLRSGHFSLEQTSQLVHQIAMEIRAAHAAKVVHRGVRPEGIFVQDEGRGELFVKVLGFDVSAQFDRRAGLPERAMSPARYMSPELLLSPEDVDGRADLWSLAAVAYYCLTGRAPFEGRSIAELLVAIDRASFTPASKFVPELPPQVDAFFAHALRRDIDARFQRAEELDEELARCRPEAPAKRKVLTPIWAVPAAVQGGAALAETRAVAAPALRVDDLSRIPVRRRGEERRDEESPRWPPPLKTEAPVAISPVRPRARYVPEPERDEDDFESDRLRRRDARHRGALGFVSAVLLAAGLIAGGALFIKQRDIAASAGEQESALSQPSSADDEPVAQAPAAQPKPVHEVLSSQPAASTSEASASTSASGATSAQAAAPAAASASASAAPARAAKRQSWRAARPAPAPTPPPEDNDEDDEDVYPTEPPTKAERTFDALSTPISTAIPAAPSPTGADLVAPPHPQTVTPLLPVPSTTGLPPVR